MKLDLKPSSQVHEADYDPNYDVLTVRLNGGTYAARDVEEKDIVNFAGAPSHGDFYHQVLRKKYKFEKI